MNEHEDKFISTVSARADIDLPVSEFEPRSMLQVPDHRVDTAKFPAVDLHNHLDALDPLEVSRVIVACGGVDERNVDRVIAESNVRALGGLGLGLFGAQEQINFCDGPAHDPLS